ncbi:hypothetical protein GCM10025876_37670 [Demequina litorisediminis]|uniref:Uncharacterized protein n=1 Tax=Demequina litorisediminis TaxID=1849022 RepID=A0ABQ6ILK9_9MICO|nr:hypothetical protein GCM10025876_37670 [Demequina litorisediminis]
MSTPSAPADRQHRIDPGDLETTLRVLASLSDVDEQDPDFVAVRNATAHMIKAVKQSRRRERRATIAANDTAVVAATATGASDRIDDETRGLTLEARAATPTAGEYLKARPCYICKQKYTVVDAFYHQPVPRVCGNQSRQAACEHGPAGTPRAADGRQGEDRYAHRAAAAARRRRPDRDDALPPRRGAALRRHARCRAVASPRHGGRHRPT